MKKIKIFIILFISIISIILIIVGLFYGFIYFIFYPHAWYNTIYSRKYNECKFNSIKINDTTNDVIKKLGLPLKKDEFSASDRIRYYNKDRDKILDIYFIKNDVIKIGNMRFLKDENEEKEILTLKKNKILDKYGTPDYEEIITPCVIYYYSSIKEGGYTGSGAIINVRRIIFDENEKYVIKIIKEENGSYVRDIGIKTELYK